MKIGPVLVFDVLEVPDFDDPAELYLWRLRIIDCPWFGIYFQRMDGPDSRPLLHNHPFTFFSIVLWGSYWERLDYEGTERHVRWWNFKRYRTDFHWIDRLDKRPTRTLMFRGKRHGSWGVIDPDGTYTRWKKHRVYGELLDALERRSEMRFNAARGDDR